MQIAILGLLLLALVLLVLALVGGNSMLALCSIVVSIVSVVAIVRGRRRRLEQGQAYRDEADRRAKLEADKDETTRVLAAAAAEASRRAAAEARPAGTTDTPGTGPVAAAELADAGDDADDGDEVDEPADEPPAADTMPPVRQAGQRRVWVVDGRPRYHLADCRSLEGRTPEGVPLAQAVEDGFTPCSLCDPDNVLVAVDQQP